MPNFSRFTNPLHEEPDYEQVREIEEIKGEMKLDLEKGDEVLSRSTRLHLTLKLSHRHRRKSYEHN